MPELFTHLIVVGLILSMVLVLLSTGSDLHTCIKKVMKNSEEKKKQVPDQCFRACLTHIHT